MKIKLFILFIFTIKVYTAQNSSNLDKIKGFDKYKFGTKPSKYKKDLIIDNIQRSARLFISYLERKEKTYLINNIEFKISNIEFDNNKRLSGIVIDNYNKDIEPGNSNFLSIKSHFEKEYGKDYKKYDNIYVIREDSIIVTAYSWDYKDKAIEITEIVTKDINNNPKYMNINIGFSTNKYKKKE